MDEAGNIIEKKLGDNAGEQAVIELIRRHRRSGKSNNAIAAWLNEQGYKTKAGKAWTHVQVGRVLNKDKK